MTQQIRLYPFECKAEGRGISYKIQGTLIVTKTLHGYEITMDSEVHSKSTKGYPDEVVEALSKRILCYVSDKFSEGSNRGIAAKVYSCEDINERIIIEYTVHTDQMQTEQDIKPEGHIH